MTKFVIALIVLLQAACEKKADTLQRTAKTDAEPATPQLDIRPFRLNAPERIAAIGDLHGDVNATRHALRLAGAIDDKDQWIGGKLVVVQTGDQLDRGDDEREILHLLDRLREAAERAGGALYALNGNHEVMNVQGDFRYVTPAGFLVFADVPPEGTNSDLLSRFIERARGRAAAFLPGGRYARKLAERDTVLQLGTTVFVHGGVSPVHVDYGIGRINAEIRAFMRGKLALLSATAAGPESPIWMRDYGMPEPEPRACDLLSHTLGLLSAERMVIGHTVQTKGISSACSGKVWRIDVGLAKYYGSRTGALEIRGSDVRVLREESQEKPSEAPAVEPRAP